MFSRGRMKEALCLLRHYLHRKLTHVNACRAVNELANPNKVSTDLSNVQTGAPVSFGGASGFGVGSGDGMTT